MRLFYLYTMIQQRELLNKLEISIAIERLCKELIEHYNVFNNTVIIGVQPRGTLLSKRIINRLLVDSNIQLEKGNIDISSILKLSLYKKLLLLFNNKLFNFTKYFSALSL